jgi:hypothetical protein
MQVVVAPAMVRRQGYEARRSRGGSAILGTGMPGRSLAEGFGCITAARGPEMWLTLWLRIMGSVGGPSFTLRIAC